MQFLCSDASSIRDQNEYFPISNTSHCLFSHYFIPSNFSAQELTELLQTFSGSNLQAIYENNTCFSLQTSIDENDENLTTVHHRYLRKFYTLRF